MVKLCFVHYRKTYRFSKENVKRITEMLIEDLLVVGHGGPGYLLTPQAQVELTLAHFGGKTLHRTLGQSHNVSRHTSRITINR